MKKLLIIFLTGLLGFFFACTNDGTVVVIPSEAAKYTQEAFDLLVAQKDFANIQDDVNVPSTILVGDNESVSVSLTKVESSSEVIVVLGEVLEVHKDTQNHNVHLTFTLSYDYVEIRYYVDATVLAIPSPWVEIENSLWASVADANSVSSNINLLPTLSRPGASIIWNSNKPSVIANDGVVVPSFGVETVVVTGILNDNGAVSLKLFTFKVAPKAYEVTEYVPYEYYNGGGEGIYANPIRNLDEQMIAFNNNQLRVGIPSVGLDREEVNLNLLVVPIEFNGTVFTPAQLTKINKGFFGTSEETGWESLTSFYNKSSFGKVNINGTVIDPYHFNMTAGAFQQQYPERGDYASIIASADHVREQLAGTFQSYDANQDGYFDGIYLVYARAHTNEWGGLWWAHKSTYMEGYTVNPTTSAPDIIYNEGDEHEIRPSAYMWASHDFLDESTNSSLHINAETFIHESGHMFGIPDYYDYDVSVGMGGGLGGADMMDANIGDHGPFNKIMLGWLVPQIVTETVTVKIYKQTLQNQQALLIPYKWTHNFFSEYLIVDYYNPTGNPLYDYGTGPQIGASGVRIYHVDATLGYPFAYNNSYTSHKLIDWVSAGNRGVHGNNFKAGSAELFQTTTTSYNWDNYSWYTLGTRNPRVKVVVQEKTADWAVVSVSYVLA